MSKYFFPTLRGYKSAWLTKDVVAGVMVATITIPVAMGYAEVAGLPSIYGLYASIFPVIAYAMFSTSRQLVYGIDASTSAIVGSAISILILTTKQNPLAIAPLLALFVSFFLMLFSILKVGRFANYLSEPVMNGFISGMAITVVISQIPKIMGLESGGTNFFNNAVVILNGFDKISLLSVTISSIIILLVLSSKKFFPRLPLPLIILIAITFLAYYFQLENHGVNTVGQVPSGLPELKLPNIFLPQIVHIASVSFAIAIIIAADSLLTARTFAAKNRQRVKENQELFAFGLSNFFASLSGTVPSGSTVSRTAMGEQYGGKSQLTAIVAAVIIGLVTLFFSHSLHYLPIPALAAIVVCALIGLIDVKSSRTLKQHSRAEFTIWLVAALGVIFVSVLFGVIMAIILSFADFVRRASTPHQAMLGRIEGRKGYFDIARHDKANSIEGILIYRFSAPLFFGNAQLFRQAVLSGLRSTKPEVKVLIVDASGITDIDSTAANMLNRLLSRITKRGTDVYIARTIDPVTDKLKSFKVHKKATFFKTLREAVKSAEAEL